MKKKKAAAWLLAAILTVGVTACTAAPQVPAPAAPDVPVVGEAPKEESSKPESSKQEESNTVSGVLESFTGGIVKIKADDAGNPELSFAVKDATIECRNMLAGDEIVIVYEGEINGTDTSGAKVRRVIDDGKNTTPAEATLTGTVVSTSMNTVEVQTNDGQRYSFATIGAELVYRNGIGEGNWVTVTYAGELRGTDTTGVRVLKIRDDDANVIAQEQEKMEIKAVSETVYATAPVRIRESYSTDAQVLGLLGEGNSIERTGICANGWSRVLYNNTDAYVYGDYLTTTAPPAPVPEQPVEVPAPVTPDAEQYVLTAIVEDAGMSTLTVLVGDSAMTFSTENAQHNYTNGIQRGNEVNITYTGVINGTDTSDVSVLSVEDTNANSTPVITGTVSDATSNTVTITTGDWINVTFYLDNAAVNCANGIILGNTVTVTIDMASAISSSNIFPALQVDDAG